VSAGALASFLTAEAKRYGAAPPVALEAGTLRGRVVTAAQRRRLESALGQSSEVLVLAEIADGRGTESWAEVAAVTPLLASPGGALSSELRPDDFSRVVRRLRFPRQGTEVLVQVACGTLGWVNESALRLAPEGAADWFGSPKMPRGRAVTPLPGQHRAFLEAAAELARQAPPYLLGGRDEERGIDCSGLVQSLLWRSTGWLLPRHSKDQMKCGERRSQETIGAGDLVFATAKARRIFHVAIALPRERVVHACLGAGRVKVESLPDFFERYRFRGARRILRAQETDPKLKQAEDKR